jgi:hypothetical protein
MVALLIVIVAVNLVLAAVVITLSVNSDRGRSVHG